MDRFSTYQNSLRTTEQRVRSGAYTLERESACGIVWLHFNPSGLRNQHSIYESSEARVKSLASVLNGQAAGFEWAYNQPTEG